eukprot:4086744-Pleurochrysis_carterae.AAC.7
MTPSSAGRPWSSVSCSKAEERRIVSRLERAPAGSMAFSPSTDLLGRGFGRTETLRSSKRPPAASTTSKASLMYPESKRWPESERTVDPSICCFRSGTDCCLTAIASARANVARIAAM